MKPRRGCIARRAPESLSKWQGNVLPGSGCGDVSHVPTLLRAGRRRDRLDASLAAPAFHSPARTRRPHNVVQNPPRSQKSNPFVWKPLSQLPTPRAFKSPKLSELLEMKIIFLLLKLDQISHLESLLVKLTEQ